MVFSEEWDAQYSEGSQMSIWPWSDLVTFVMRYARPEKPGVKVLELGCGAGANISFFKYMQADYYAIEGSASIVGKLHEKYPELKEKIVVGDFTKEIPFDGKFDIIFDRASLAHNNTAAIKKCIGLASDKLADNGKYIGIDWFSTFHSEYSKGRASGEDEFTRTGYTENVFAGVGRVHFSTKEHVLDIFRDFEVIELEHKSMKQEIPELGFLEAFWNFAMRKK